MPQARRLEEYMPLVVRHGKNPEITSVRKLHERVGDFRERFLKEKPLQDLLMNDGYELEEENRPSSYLDIRDATILRTKTIPHLAYVNSIIDVATKPRICILHQRNILIPGEVDQEEVRTPEGYEFEKVEMLQTKWLTEPETAEAVRAYQGNLTKAVDEFDMKFILNRMLHARQIYFHQEPRWRDIIRLQAEIEPWDNDSYTLMDSAYYEKGREFLSCSGRNWEHLKGTEFGKMFILTEEEAMQFLKDSKKRLKV